MAVNDGSETIMEKVMEAASKEDETFATWRTRLSKLDLTIHRLTEQIASRPSVPTELQDEYRAEMDAITLENMQLNAKLEQTESALKRAKFAYKEEVRHNMVLEQKLNDLEARLIGAIRGETMN